MIPTLPQDSRDGLAEQWRAMMMKQEAGVEGNEVYQNNDVVQDRYYHPQYQEPEGERFDENYAQRRDRPTTQHNNIDAQRYSHSSEEYLAERERYHQHQNEYHHQHAYQHQLLLQTQQKEQQQLNYFRQQQQQRKLARGDDNKLDLFDGIIENLSDQSNNHHSGLKSIFEQTRKGWSIHESQRRTLERESRRALEESLRKKKSLSQSTLRNQEGSERKPYYDDGGEHYAFVEERESPSSSRPNDGYADENRPTHNQSSSANAAYTPTISQKNQAWGSKKSLFDKQLSPESPISPEQKVSVRRNTNINTNAKSSESRQDNRSGVFGHVHANISRNSDPFNRNDQGASRKRSILKEHQAPSPYLSPSNRVMKSFIPKTCGPGNADDPLETVVDLFDAPIRIAANKTSFEYPSINTSRGQQQNANNTQRNVSSGRRGTPSNDAFFQSSTEDFFEQSDHASNFIPKTEAQKRHEKEMLQAVNSMHRIATDPPVNPAESMKLRLAQNGSIDRSIHDDIWGSESVESVPRNNRTATMISSSPRPPHSSGEKIDTRAIPVSSPNVAENFESIANPILSREPSLASGLKDDLLSQLTRCNGTGQISPPRLSNLFSKSIRKSEEEATPSSALNMFEEIQRQITGKKNLDSSGFPVVENLDPNKQAEQDQRLKQKLDAVRARSVRNAELFGKMENDKKPPAPSQEVQQQQASFASFGDSVIASEGKSSVEKSSAGKRLDSLFDQKDNEMIIESSKPPPGTDTKSKFSCNSRSSCDSKGATCGSRVTKESLPEEVGHYMYVAYSQFGQDARKVLKLCGHHSLPTPDRRNGEILIKVLAATVSPSDCAIRRGEWPNVEMDPYIIPGTAMVGRVMEMDRKKSRTSFSSSSIEPGDIVLSLSTSGGNARYTCLPKCNLVKLPKETKPERAVCLAESYLSAFQALHLGQKGAMRYRETSLQGKSVLIMGGYSPFGKAVIELCRTSGAAFCYALVENDSQGESNGGNRVSSAANSLRQQCDALEQWGAIPLSNNPQDWLTLIGRQIDIFITTYDRNENGEGTNMVSSDHWKALKKDGQVHVVCSHPGMDEVEQRDLIFGTRKKGNESKGFRLPSCRPGGREKMADRAIYYNLFDNWEGDRGTKAVAKKDLEHLVQLLNLELINPEIIELFSLAKLAKAHRSHEHRKISGAGHLVCSPWIGEKGREEATTNRTKETHGENLHDIT